LVSRFDCVLAAVLHEDPSVTHQIINFTNEMAKSKFSPFIGRPNLKIEDGIEGFGYVKTAEDVKGLERALREAEFLDNFMVGSGGFILGSEGGIPYEMSVECFRGLIRLSRRYRKNKPP